MRSSQRRTVDPSGMRDRNATLILKMIWDANEISRADLARNTGMSPSTVSAIVAELQEAGLVRFVRAGASTGGRRPQLVAFCDDAYVLIGIEVGAKHVTVVAMDMHGRALADETVQCFTRDTPTETLETMMRVTDEVLARPNIRTRTLVGVGAAMPSPVLPGGGGRLSPMVMPAWQGVDVCEVLQERYDVPAFAENDANAGAIAEQWWGAGREGADLTYVKLGTGVGAGHIIHGRLHRGAGGAASAAVQAAPPARSATSSSRPTAPTAASATGAASRRASVRPRSSRERRSLACVSPETSSRCSASSPPRAQARQTRSV